MDFGDIFDNCSWHGKWQFSADFDQKLADVV